MITKRKMEQLMNEPFLELMRDDRRAASECRVPAGGPGGGQFSECGGSGSGSGLRGYASPDRETSLKMVNDWVNDDAFPFDLARDPNTELGARFSVALDELPAHQGTVFRGTQMTPGEISVIRTKSEISLEKHSSASKRLEVAEEYSAEHGVARGKQAVLFEIQGKTSRDVGPSDAFDQQEVILKAGTRYSVVRARKYKLDGQEVVTIILREK